MTVSLLFTLRFSLLVRYIHCFNFTIHLIMTTVRSKRRFLPLIFIVKRFNLLSANNKQKNFASLDKLWEAHRKRELLKI